MIFPCRYTEFKDPDENKTNADILDVCKLLTFHLCFDNTVVFLICFGSVEGYI